MQRCGTGAPAQLCFTGAFPHPGRAEIPGNCWSGFTIRKRSQFAGGNTVTKCKGSCILILTVSSSPCLNPLCRRN